ERQRPFWRSSPCLTPFANVSSCGWGSRPIRYNALDQWIAGKSSSSKFGTAIRTFVRLAFRLCVQYDGLVRGSENESEESLWPQRAKPRARKKAPGGISVS